MAGTSDRERETNRQLDYNKGFQNDIRNGFLDAENPFKNYQNPFDYGDITRNLNQAFQENQNILNRNSADAIASGQRGLTSSLASRGITGGSALDTAQSGLVSDITSKKNDTIAKLGANRSNQFADLMKYFDTQDYRTKSTGGRIDLANKKNILSGINYTGRLNQGLLGGLSDDTLFDDILSVVKTGAGVSGTIAGIPGI